MSLLFILQVCRHLLNAGHSVTINTGAPLDFFRQQLPHQALSLRTLLLDSGAVQLDAFTVDMKSERHGQKQPYSLCDITGDIKVTWKLYRCYDTSSWMHVWSS